MEMESEKHNKLVTITKKLYWKRYLPAAKSASPQGTQTNALSQF